MILTDLFPTTELYDAIAAGLVRVVRHPDEPLRIYNYTERAQYSRSWTRVTRNCRGLIVGDDDVVVARPFPKFFNYGEEAAPTLSLDEPCIATDKLDGSLGIIYPTSSGHAVATRGSFTSDQALHATAVLRSRYPDFAPDPRRTYLVEIIYPANRIVVDYSDCDDLFLLGAVNISSGLNDDSDGWPGPATGVLPPTTLRQALVAAPRPGHEGMVLHFSGGAFRLKLKQDEYIRLHRILTGLTARTLWEHLAVWDTLTVDVGTTAEQLTRHLHLDPARVAAVKTAGPGWLPNLLELTPVEFQDWVHATLARLARQVADIEREVAYQYGVWYGYDRRDAAAALSSHSYRGLIFAALDGKPYQAQVWAAVYPPHERPFQ